MSPDAPALPTQRQVDQERARLEGQQRANRRLAWGLVAVLATAAVTVLLNAFLFPLLSVAGASMEPALEDGDLVVVNKAAALEPGDLCAFYVQNKLLIKRVVAVPGDYVNIAADGTVSVNGRPLDEPYVSSLALGQCDIELPCQVPENHYFLLGDHRETSIDSRSSAIGTVSTQQIVGQVVVRLWPSPTFSFQE